MRDAEAGDAALLGRAVAGDGEAFGLLFDRHRERVFRHACRLVESRQDAEDVVAASFLELWRRRSDARLVNDSVLPWLLATATNVSRNLSRATRRYRDLLARLPREPLVADPATLITETSLLGVDGTLRDALQQLNERDLAIFALVTLEGFTVAEAATVVGLRLPAAKSRLQRVRARMRAQLDPAHAPGSATSVGEQA
jgi:RNA polymerase sigma-70 factor (ECF subfamily)